MNPRYKNRFYVDGNQVYLDYDKSFSKRYTRLDNRIFHREDLNGSLVALRDSYLSLRNVDLDHEFDFRLDRWNGTSHAEYQTGKFFKTDNEFDEDRQIVKINVKATDRYEKLLRQANKELDLVRDLEPPLYTVNYKKPAMIQVTFWRTPYLVNIIGDTSYVLESPNLPGGPLEDFGFLGVANDSATPRLGYIPGTNDMVVDVSGIYEVPAPSGTFYLRQDGNFRIMQEDIGGGSTQWIIRGVNDFAALGIVYRIPETDVPLFPADDVDHTFSGSRVFESETTDSQCKFFQTTPYIRVLTDQDEISSVPTIELPEEGEDIGGYTFGYRRRVDLSVYDSPLFVPLPFDLHQSAPTAFGKFSEDALHFPGEYFTEPVLLNIEFVPMVKLAWREFSLWGFIGQEMAELLPLAGTDKSCRDAYELGDVIKYVLRALDDTIVFDSDVFHSQFFYKTTNPLTSETYGLTHFVTAKSNIIIGDYDNPATRGIITFSDIEQLLHAAKCVWYINKQNHFIVEHVQYFANGRSYTTEIISNDLTVQIEPKNQKPWAYRTKKYRYGKERMPERYEFSWMDEVSDIFKGYPIGIRSQFVEQGQVETIAVSKFTSDIDFGQSRPEGLSKDGFYIIAATFVDDEYTVQYDDLDVPGLPVVKIQNAFWSFPFLHEKFHRHGLPAPDVTINGVDTTATSTKRAKEQELIYPGIEPDAMRLVRTSLGVAEIESMEVNLTSGETKLRVLLDMDFDNPG